MKASSVSSIHPTEQRRSVLYMYHNLGRLTDELERELYLIGATAVEDKL